ncbi:dihydroxyacetone kinase subunit DhaK [Gottschalkiaceae bacterium SANA]|nr:dihydroxyacetone kinase subunit DhaK [Gottschalkiaceae bacterium SANA]
MKMKKFINEPVNLTEEILEGLALSNPDLVEFVDQKMIVNKKLKEADRVTIVTLGGTGHEPAISGFVGEGMIDISVPGDIFAAPGPGPCLDAIRMADKGKGVLFVVLNHAGDMLTGDMVMKRAKKEGLNVMKVVTQEDISNAPREEAHDRRGLVGCLGVYKVAGAVAAEGKSLEEVAAVAQKFADNMATIAVASRGATHPSTGETISNLGEEEMEIGMGQHGEGGGGRQKMGTANETANIMLEALLKDLEIKEKEKVMVLVNGTGATTLMELLLVYRQCHKTLATKNIEIAASLVGEYLTVQEMCGFQLCIARMDEEMIKYWQAPCKTPYHTV